MWWEALLWSLLAGVGGTLIGALIPISVHGKGEKVLSLLMAFTAGFMAALVFLDVLPESLEAGGKIWLTLLITLVGAAIVFAAGLLLDKKSGEHKHAPHIEAEIADEAEGKRDLYVGLSLAVLLAQHNEVCALDVVPGKVEALSRGESPVRDALIERFLAQASAGERHLDLTATIDPRAAYVDADFVVVATPTDYDPKKNHFDTSSVCAATKSLSSSVKGVHRTCTEARPP